MTITLLLLVMSTSVCLGMEEYHHDPHSHPHHGPVTTVVHTPLGPQWWTQNVNPDGSTFWSTSGPGFNHATFTTGGNPNGFHYTSMTGPGGYHSSSSNGLGYQSSSSSIGNGMGFQSSGMQMGMGTGMAPMEPMKWWPSIFGKR